MLQGLRECTAISRCVPELLVKAGVLNVGFFSLLYIIPSVPQCHTYDVTHRAGVRMRQNHGWRCQHGIWLWQFPQYPYLEWVTCFLRYSCSLSQVNFQMGNFQLLFFEIVVQGVLGTLSPARASLSYYTAVSTFLAENLILNNINVFVLEWF